MNTSIGINHPHSSSKIIRKDILPRVMPYRPPDGTRHWFIKLIAKIFTALSG